MCAVRWLIAMSSLLLAACAGEAPDTSDAAAARDAGPRDAAARLDAAGARDAALDAGTADAAEAGVSEPDASDDAGLADAGLFTPGGPPEGDPSFIVTDGTEPLVQGQVLSWFAGPQGGHHVFAGARLSADVFEPLTDVQRRALLVSYQLRRVSDDRLIAEARRSGGFVAGAGGYVSPTVLLILVPEFLPAQLEGQLLLETATVRMPDGSTRTSRAYVTTTCCS